MRSARVGTRHNPPAAGLHQVWPGSTPSCRHIWGTLTSAILRGAALQVSTEGVTCHSHDPAGAFRSNHGFLLS